MDKINRINSIVSLLKTQVTKNQQRSSHAGRKSNGASGPTLTRDITQLNSIISERIKRLSGESPKKRIKSIQLVIESILEWEFGDEILMDPELSTFVSKLVENIDASEELKSLYDKYINGIK